jgi:hypothetical protein
MLSIIADGGPRGDQGVVQGSQAQGGIVLRDTLKKSRRKASAARGSALQDPGKWQPAGADGQSGRQSHFRQIQRQRVKVDGEMT